VFKRVPASVGTMLLGLVAARYLASNLLHLRVMHRRP
jgi:hypothetical protein